MPFESTPLSTVISGATPPGITVDSHRDITSGSALTSRLECWEAADVFDSRVTWHQKSSFGR